MEEPRGLFFFWDWKEREEGISQAHRMVHIKRGLSSGAGHTAMEADKLEARSQQCSPNSKAGRLEVLFQFEPKGRKKLMAPPKPVRQEESLSVAEVSAILSYSLLHLIARGPPTWEGHLLPQSTDSSASFI